MADLLLGASFCGISHECFKIPLERKGVEYKVGPQSTSTQRSHSNLEKSVLMSNMHFSRHF